MLRRALLGDGVGHLMEREDFHGNQGPGEQIPGDLGQIFSGDGNDDPHEEDA